MRTYDDELIAEWEKGVIEESGLVSREAWDSLAASASSPWAAEIEDIPVENLGWIWELRSQYISPTIFSFFAPI